MMDPGVRQFVPAIASQFEQIVSFLLQCLKGLLPRPVHSSESRRIIPRHTPRERRSHLLALPAEIRQYIFELVLTQHVCFRHPHSGRPQERIHNPLLTVSRQIYRESSLLIFRTSLFAFQQWHGSSLFCCLNFVKSLQNWQRVALRKVDLTINVRDLDACRIEKGWLELCRVLDSANRDRGNLRRLALRIHGGAAGQAVGPAEVDGRWITKGLSRLQSLNQLHLVVDAALVAVLSSEPLAEKLSGVLPSTEIQIREWGG